MISYVKGILSEVFDDSIVVETGGIGYNIFVPLTVIEGLKHIGLEIQIYTYLQVKEDGMNLYGFLDRNDLSIFKQLIGVNGIGPRGAISLLSTMSCNDFRMAVISGDSKAISRAPGIGAKTAQRIILDLKDKIAMEDIFRTDNNIASASDTAIWSSADKETIEALISLGYSPFEASKAVRSIEITEDMTVEDTLKAALKYLALR